MKPTRAFIHGLESTSRGTKGEFFRERYPDMILEDFTGTFSQRMEKLEGLLAGKNPLILVGSSFGGLMAAVYACRHQESVAELILLAPALHVGHYAPYGNKKLHVPITIYHGLHDEVVPIEAIRSIAQELYSDHRFYAVDDDHSLHATFASLNWDDLLHVDSRTDR
jgi:pimeloyl-ACP methyl ester carboxylesterase